MNLWVLVITLAFAEPDEASFVISDTIESAGDCLEFARRYIARHPPHTVAARCEPNREYL